MNVDSEPKVASLLQYVAATIPFYVARLRQVEQPTLCEFPIMTRQDAQVNFDALVAPGVSVAECVVEYTTGSTGEPLVCIKSRREAMLCQRRLWRWRGRWLADPLSARLFAFASNYALPPDTGVPTRRPPGSYYGSLIVSYVTPREVTEEAPHAIIDRIIASRANWIRGTPSLLEHFAERVSAAEAARLRDARISFVECTGENLSEAVRQQLSTTFGARIVNLYAAREVWPIACECEFGTLHTEEGHVRLELLNENQYERGGEVCVTALNLRTFPFVRYALGDVVELSSDGCGCGRNGEIVKSIRGRVGQMFSIGRHKYSANVFSDAVKEATALGFVALGRFQVFERHEGSFVYRIERRAALSGGEEEYLSKRLTERLGRTIVIAIEWCDEIPAQTGEKRTFFFGKGD